MKHRTLAGVVFATTLFASPLLPGNLYSETVPARNEISIHPDLNPASGYGRKLLRDFSKKGVNQKNDSRALLSIVVLGEVMIPGEYEISGQVNLIKAILAAGGPSDTGSLRRVEILRNGNVAAVADLYEFFAAGRFANEFKFQGGEVINVPAAGPFIAINGRVQHPGVFELKKDELFLDKALQLCGGILPSDSGSRLEIMRQISGLRRVFLAFELEPGEKIPPAALLPGDEVIISKSIDRRRYVSLEGFCEARRIAFKDGLRLSELLAGARLQAGAALEYAEILRESGRAVCDVIGFSPEAIVASATNDIGLRAGDRVVIFSQEFLKKNPVVFVEGMVKQSGKFMLSGETNIRKIIAMAGGLKEAGRPMAAELSRREIVDGQLKFSRVEVNITAALKDDPRHNLILKPFDSLRVFDL